MFADGNKILTEKFNKPSKDNWTYWIREKAEKSTSSYDNGWIAFGLVNAKYSWNT